MRIPTSFELHPLGGGHTFYTGSLPAGLMPSPAQFDALWLLHPNEYHEIEMYGQLVHTPRWQQAYGRDYFYTGRVNKALPIAQDLAPLLAWTKEQVDERINGLLLNWYDGRLDHYIGSHRDSTKDMILGAPIVTISFGEERIFRIRPSKRGGGTSNKFDFQAENGAVFIMPYETNLAFKHEVPAHKKWTGRRISVTFRAFGPHQP